MGEDWSREEVEATITDYLSMLDAQLRDQPYNKTEHRRRLSALLNSRSDGAIERKHQNISAALRDLGFPWIPGYKPLSNYQRLLFDVIADRLEGRTKLADLVEAQINRPVEVPTVDDILSCLVEAPPSVPEAANHDVRLPVERNSRPSHVDYLARESMNRSLGAAGEEFVMRFEVARLLQTRHHQLAQRVERVSETRGDGVGYDILSYEDSGRERLVEVKTTGFGRETPFFVTRNELDVSQKNHEQYVVYRVFDFRREPRLFLKRGDIHESFRLEVTQYRANIN